MILTEDFGNLNKIDSSFLNDGNGNPIKLKNKLITPNSEIAIDKVKPHSIDGLIKLLDDEYNQAVIFRLFNRQLFLITNKGIYNTYSYDNYQIRLTPFLIYKLGDILVSYSVRGYDSKAKLKTFIKEIYNSLVSLLEGKKPKWDAIIIKSDLSGIQKQSERTKANRDKEIKPNEKEYQNFIYDLKQSWKEKCIKFLKSHQADNMTGQEIKQYLLTRSMIDEFTFQGEKYIRQKSGTNLLWINTDNTIVYSRENLVNDGKFNHIKIVISFSGFRLKINSIKGCKEKTSYSENWESLI